MNKRQKLVQQQFLDNEEAVIKRLKAVYNQSLKDITEQSKKFQAEIMQLQALIDEEADEATKATLKSMQQSKIYQKQYQDALKKQINGILDTMQVEEFKTVDEYLKKCYEDGFIGTMYDLQGQGIPMCMPLDQEAMVRAVQTDSKISQGLYQRLGEDVDLLKRKITAQVSRGIATGMTFQQVAQQLEAYTNIGYNNAVRIARTEGHRIQVQSTMDACYKAKDIGADVVKQWDSALDKRTRESHAKVDGEIRELDKPFSNGLMFPGDPHGGAAEVVNCRCALLQRAKWALDDKELETLKERAAYYGLDKTDNFNDYKKKYLKASEAELKKLEKNGIINNKNYDCELAKKFGKEHYDAMHERVVNSNDKNLAAAWKKYEADIKVGDAKYKGHEHCMVDTIYLNGAKDAKGNSWQAPYQVTFHEAGHAIDSLAKKTVQNSGVFARHYSAAYKDGLFPQTIKDEVADYVKAKDKELKAIFKEHAGDVEWFNDNGFIPGWKYKWYKEGTYKASDVLPKYRKSFAYSAVEKEIKASGSKLAIADLSDIVEGATGGKIQCGFGHGTKYWKDRTYNGVADGLATEAFAEMIDSTFSCPESLETIQKWLPKSYGVFQEMIENLLK